MSILRRRSNKYLQPQPSSNIISLITTISKHLFHLPPDHQTLLDPRKPTILHVHSPAPTYETTRHLKCSVPHSRQRSRLAGRLPGTFASFATKSKQNPYQTAHPPVFKTGFESWLLFRAVFILGSALCLILWTL